MNRLAEVCGSNITPFRVPGMNNRLAGKTVHVVGPRRMENEVLVSFIKREVGADCFVTPFEEIERYITMSTDEPSRLFLIDYREPKLRQILKEMSLNGTATPLAQCLASLFHTDAGNGGGANGQGIICGFFYQCDSSAALLNGIRTLFEPGSDPRGGLFECAETRGSGSECPLTRRELHILLLIAEGLRNHEIATRISISGHTVRTHLYNIFRKIGTRNRLEASVWIDRHVSKFFLRV